MQIQHILHNNLPVRAPADFLFAALEVLETGADEVTVAPREQLGDIARYLPKMATTQRPTTTSRLRFPTAISDS